MNKLSFRARALDASKPLPIYLSEELPDLPEYSAINRAVPQMPSGMEKEEECEHHLQRAIVTGLIIPTPEVSKIDDMVTYDRLYPADYKPPRQLIRMQPFAMEEDYPDYDIDSEDEKWITMQKLDISPRKFEEMMDRLEKNCAQNFATQDRRELLLKDDDELSIAIYDYWLSKRLKTPTALVPTVKTELNNRGGPLSVNSNNNPYLAFRRRTEKMQTRKNRKNDEASYEKMIKLKRDLSRALELLELVKRREATKRDLLHTTIQIYEKRYQAGDLNGALLAEVYALKPVRPAFSPLYSNQFAPSYQNWAHKPPKDDVGVGRKEKRIYKKRKHKVVVSNSNLSSGEEESSSPPSPTQQAAYPFLRNKNCTYQAPLSGGKIGNWSWCSPEEGGSGDPRFRFSLSSVSTPYRRCVGLARRRLGRGGRVIIDRAGPSSMDDFWSSLDYTIHDNFKTTNQPAPRHFRPKSPADSPPRPAEVEETDLSEASWLNVQVESVQDSEITDVSLDLGELFPDLGILRQDLGCGRRLTSPPCTPTSALRGGSSLLERWVESSTASTSSCSIKQTCFDISETNKQTFNCESISGSECCFVGSSQFFVTDGKDRTSSRHLNRTTSISPTPSGAPSTSNKSPVASTSATSFFNSPSSSSQSLKSSTTLTSSSPSPILNGPISKQNEHGTSWLLTTTGQSVVCKQHGSNSIASSSPTSLLKLPARSNPAQIGSEEVESDSKRSSVSLLQHTQPMEVT